MKVFLQSSEQILDLEALEVVILLQLLTEFLLTSSPFPLLVFTIYSVNVV